MVTAILNGNSGNIYFGIVAIETTRKYGRGKLQLPGIDM